MSTAFQSLASLCLAKLVDMGLIRYDHLVTQYWPEFGQHGKANVTVERLVSHMAGLAVIDHEMTLGSD